MWHQTTLILELDLCSPQAYMAGHVPLLSSRSYGIQFLPKASQALWAHNQSLPSVVLPHFHLSSLAVTKTGRAGYQGTIFPGSFAAFCWELPQNQEQSFIPIVRLRTSNFCPLLSLPNTQLVDWKLLEGSGYLKS